MLSRVALPYRPFLQGVITPTYMHDVANNEAVTLNSVSEILQTLQGANNFEINGAKFIINLNRNDIADSIAHLATARGQETS